MRGEMYGGELQVFFFSLNGMISLLQTEKRQIYPLALLPLPRKKLSPRWNSSYTQTTNDIHTKSIEAEPLYRFSHGRQQKKVKIRRKRGRAKERKFEYKMDVIIIIFFSCRG